MTSPRLLFILIVVGFAAGCASQPQRPNIILIMADDLGYETLGVNGSTSYQTPNLDALAEGGMRFTHAYATPLCTPSRVQLMTGKYNFRNYIGFGLLNPAERTFGHLLQDAGYRTAVVGKWQLYGNARQQELAGGRTGSLPQQAGFDEHSLWQVEERGPRFKDPHLDVAGLPEDFVTDGLSFYPQLVGRADSVRAWVFCHYAPHWGSFAHRQFVHDKAWKLYDDGAFYHVATDPEEQQPVADDALTEDVRRLKRRFQAVLDRMQ